MPTTRERLNELKLEQKRLLQEMSLDFLMCPAGNDGRRHAHNLVYDRPVDGEGRYRCFDCGAQHSKSERKEATD